MYALIQDDDIKSQMLAKEIDDIELIKMKGSTNIIPIHLIKQILKRKKLPKAVILRYLNDSNSFIKSFIRFMTNLITVILIKLLGIRLIWICHNVDKESKEYYPLLVRIRREIVTKFADKILVTDKFLIKHAARILNVDDSKVDYITFGRPDSNDNLDSEDDIHQEIIRFVQNDKQKDTLIGFSIGNPNVKVLQPFYTDEIIKKAAASGINIKIILGGPLGEFIKKHDVNAYKNLLSNPNVLFLDGKIKLNESYISNYIDFYWRVYDDFSVPFTVYNAAYLKKPILTMNKGFLKEMVMEYNLGYVLDNDMSNVLQAMNDLKHDRTEAFDDFIKTHNWRYGAEKLYTVISN